MKKLSIIIALYNTEKYIEKCVRSAACLSLPIDDYEIIIVNDGSNDNGPAIVRNIALEYSNIQLIDKANGGQSSARNIGFGVAKGKYIFCLDSDDSINGDEFERALEYAVINDLDLLPIHFKKIDENGNEIGRDADNYNIITAPISGGEFMNTFTISGTMWRYFYRRDIIVEQGLKLMERVYHEDEEFVVKFFSFCKKIAYQKHNVYNYLQRSNSTINNKNKAHRLKLINDLVLITNSLNLHKEKFSKSSLEYRGVLLKVEQLSVGIFFRMKSDDMKFVEVMKIISALKGIGIYPLNIKYQNIKFRLASIFFNSKFLCKLYFR